MKGSLIVLSLLIIGLIISQGTIFAKATKTEVTGVFDFADGYDISHPEFRTWVDGDGKTHYKNLIGRGNLSLAGEGININGKQEVVINGWQDEIGGTGVGKWQGTTTVTIEGGIVVFEGHWTIPEYENFITLRATLEYQGRGPFEGLLLKGTFREIGGNTDVFEFDGYVLDTHGE